MAESPNRPVPVLHLPRAAFASDHGPCVASLMTNRSPARGLRALIKSAVPRFAAENLELVPSARPHVHYFATASDHDPLMLSLSPRATRLLRSEHSLIHSEAVLLQWLSGSAEESSLCEPHQTDSTAAGSSGTKRHMMRRTTATGALQRFLPRLVKHGPAKNVGHSEYILTRPIVGTTVAALTPPLGKTERKWVDFQVGQLLRRISSQKSPNGKFGTAVAVLSSEPAAPDASWKRVTTSGLNSRHDRWSDAFLSLLEASLRDAEDFKVAIRYEAVRDHVSRFRRFLDAVTSPCLVAVDAGEDTNTLVAPVAGNRIQENGHLDWNGIKGQQPADRCFPVAESGYSDDASDVNDNVAAMTGPGLGAMQVTGIREWSNCIFGDPLFASVLSRNASQEVWDGFKSPLRDHDPEVPDRPLEDVRNAEVRRLLYECHHAVTAIVREYCRRCNDSDDREMPARKRLTQALRTLDSMDDVGKKRRPHPSGEASPAKRPKPDDEDCGCK